MAKKWIADAIKHPGALHEELHVPKGKKIPERKLEAAAKKPGVEGRRARLAETLEGFHHEGKSMKHEHDCSGKHCKHPSHEKHERKEHHKGRKEHEAKKHSKHSHESMGEKSYEREHDRAEAPIRVPPSHKWPNDERGIAPARSNQMMGRHEARKIKIHRV